MPKSLPRAARDNLEKCRAATIAAVDVYNRPGPRFRTAHFIALIVMAWTALFHAIFYRKRRKPWYKKKGKNPKGDRYVHIDGEPKHWELGECLAQHFGGNNPPERKNLEFLIGLRNKIEHRHLPELDAGLYGECQAALLNLEELLTSEFGVRYALAEQLAVSLQFSRLIPSEKKKAAKELAVASHLMWKIESAVSGSLCSVESLPSAPAANVALSGRWCEQREHHRKVSHAGQP